MRGGWTLAEISWLGYCVQPGHLASRFPGPHPVARARRKKREASFASLLSRSSGQAREALACSAIFANAALSWTARSASTFRSTSISAFLSPFMNTL